MANNNIHIKVGADHTELTGLIKTTDQTKRSLDLVSKSFARTNDQKAWMRGVNQIVSAQKKLEASSRMSRSEIMKLAHEYRQAAQFSNALSEATGRLAGVTGQMGRRMSRSGVLVQQSGYQIGDFLVQLQSGTNALVAFGQQATQMAGTLTLLGGKFIAIGTVLGVAIPLVTAIGAAFMRTRQSSDKTSEGLITLEKRLKSLDATLQDWTRTKKAASLGITVEELLGATGLEKAKKDLSDATAELVKLEDTLGGAAGALGTLQFAEIVKSVFGADKASQYKAAVKEVEEAAKRLAAIQAKIRQEAREEAEESLLETMENQAREQALLEYMAGQKVIAERKAWVSEAIGIFRDAQKRMRDKDIAITERTLEHLFRSRTLYYSLRFSGESEVMSQDLKPSGKMRPDFSYKELIAMGWSPEDLERIGLLPPVRKAGGMKTKDPLLDLQKRIALDTKLLGVSREQAQVERAIANSKIKYSDQEIANTVKELEVYNLKLARIKETQALYGTVQSSLESGFMAMVDGTKSVEDAFKDMAKSVIAELYRVLVVKRMVGSFEGGTGIMGMLGGIFGKASGGTVMSGTPYLVGEKGPELIVPQNRGHVMNADLTAKAMNGSKGETVVVNQTINVSTGVQQTVRSEIKQLMPQIAQSAKSAVVDAKRRGGSYGRAFS